jgi:hypothetical protein
MSPRRRAMPIGGPPHVKRGRYFCCLRARSGVASLHQLSRAREGPLRRLVTVVLAFGAMLGLAACVAKTTGTTGITDGMATLHATARCDNGETCKW